MRFQRGPRRSGDGRASETRLSDGSGIAAAGDALDSARLDELRQLEVHGAEGLLAKLFETFLTDAGAGVGALRSALEAGDVTAAGYVCHRLKGTAATLGATEVVHVCMELEAAISSGGLQLYPSLLERLESELVRVARAADAL